MDLWTSGRMCGWIRSWCYSGCLGPGVGGRAYRHPTPPTPRLSHSPPSATRIPPPPPPPPPPLVSPFPPSPQKGPPPPVGLLGVPPAAPGPAVETGPADRDG